MAGLRVIFMGTPAFALPTLSALIASEHTICAVYCQPPRPAGRGQKLSPSLVQLLAQSHDISVFHPTSLKGADEQAIFAAHAADVAVVAAYGLLLPQAILDAPRLGCINIHPSALPRWRGAAPIQRTIMAGDSDTACCIMHMDAGLDTGAILARETVMIADGTTAGQLHDDMAQRGARMTLDVLAQMICGEHRAVPQAHDGVTYAAKITKADMAIDWSKTASEICNQVRGLAPSPSATFLLDGEIAKCCNVIIAPETHDVACGTLLDDAGLVACGHGTTLRITTLQRAGKQRVSMSDYLCGNALTRATVLA